MKSLPALALWLLIVALPFNGYASAVAGACSSHRAAAATAQMHDHRSGMSMPAMADHASMSMPADHGGSPHHAAAQCHCAAMCVAQCGAALTAAFVIGALPTSNETLPRARIAAPRPSSSFDLLRPPKHTAIA